METGNQRKKKPAASKKTLMTFLFLFLILSPWFAIARLNLKVEKLALEVNPYEHAFDAISKEIPLDTKILPLSLRNLSTQAAETESLKNLLREDLNIVFYWIPSCEGCKEDMTNLLLAADALRSKGVSVSGVLHGSFWDDVDSNRSYIDEDLLSLTDGLEDKGVALYVEPLQGNPSDLLQDLLNVVATPSFYLMDSQGVVVDIFIGQGSSLHLMKSLGLVRETDTYGGEH